MKLLYLYIRDYGILQDVEFNFDSEYHFHFNLATKQLTQRDPESKLADDFFSINKKGNDRVVESVSAIVGNNGSGKTSVARFLHELYSNNTLEHIIIWKDISDDKGRTGKENESEEKPDFKYSSLILSDEVRNSKAYNIHEMLGEERNNQSKAFIQRYKQYDTVKPKRHNDPISSTGQIYTSSSYTPLHINLVELFNCRDISTSCLMKNERLPHEHIVKSISQHSMEQVTTHDRMELNRITEFFSVYHNNKEKVKQRVKLPIPKNIQVTLESPLGRIRTLIAKNNESEKEVEKKTNLPNALPTLEKLIEKLLQIENSMLCKSICGFILNFYENRGGSIQLHQLLQDNFKKLLYDISDDPDNYFSCFIRFIRDTLEKCKKLEKSDASAKKSNGIKILSGITEKKYIELSKAEDFFNFLRQICDGNSTEDKSQVIDDNIGSIDFDIVKDIETYTKFLEFYYNIYNKRHLYNFTCYPPISTGEYYQLSLYSRLYSLEGSQVEDKEESIIPGTRHNIHSMLKQKNLIIFFDEIEITVHPGLQRQLMSNVIKFFEEFYHGRKVHLIFATHSPVLLSDIPKSNVCFLKRTTGKNVSPVVKNVTDKIKDNTFGANIHSLYRHSFFMEDGSMGALAERKINEIFDELNSPQSENLEMDKYVELENRINLIGEPVIRDNLMNLLISKCYDPDKAKLVFLEKQVKELKQKVRK
jgi:energy-coupling factor transporter ATP-binding protein EcfA2